METAANRKTGDAFRNFAEPARDSVREFYRQSHARQSAGCHVQTSWGHDEYLYHLVRDYLPLTVRFRVSR